jgi:hypothetical protein
MTLILYGPIIQVRTSVILFQIRNDFSMYQVELTNKSEFHPSEHSQ